MRRFAQAIADLDSLPSGLPENVAKALVNSPDRYNVGKGKPATVIAACANSATVVTEMTWGLVPRWSKEPITPYTTVTARLARAPTSRIYSAAWKERPCVVPMSGYYKWDRERKPPWPHFIQNNDGLVLLAAGLWEGWEGADGRSLLSFTLLTGPNAAIPAPLTADGPVLLEPRSALRWLARELPTPRALLQHSHASRLGSYTVGRQIRDPTRDDYTLLEPVDPERNLEEPEDSADTWDEDDD